MAGLEISWYVGYDLATMVGALFAGVDGGWRWWLAVSAVIAVACVALRRASSRGAVRGRRGCSTNGRRGRAGRRSSRRGSPAGGEWGEPLGGGRPAW
ncbi:hypothetical protein ACIRPX_36565 [Streptomyces sp. NPDC101225]|uniref:hypothetical protein n=1 Tax=Streptomyces sp. NPDC101225 TaxID=3366135 RepID=UPI003803FB68